MFFNLLEAIFAVLEFVFLSENSIVPAFRFLTNPIQDFLTNLRYLLIFLGNIPTVHWLFDFSLLYILTNFAGLIRMRWTAYRFPIWLVLVGLYSITFLATRMNANLNWLELRQELAIITLVVFSLLILFWLVYTIVNTVLLSRRKLDTNMLDKHVIMVDADGCPLKLNSTGGFGPFLSFKPMCDVAFKQKLNVIQAGLADADKVVMFVHGGMNELQPNLRLAEERCISIKKDGAYPIIIIWRSSLISSYWAHLTTVRQGRKRERWIFLFWMIPATLLADIGRGITRVLKTWYYQFITDMKPLMPPFNPDMSNVKEIEEKIRKSKKSRGRLHNNVFLALGEDTRRNGVPIKIARFFDYFSPITLITSYLVWPIVDAFGKSAWDVMLRRTKTLFNATYEFDLLTSNECVDESKIRKNQSQKLNAKDRKDIRRNLRQNLRNELFEGKSTAALAQFLDDYLLNFLDKHDPEHNEKYSKDSSDLTIDSTEKGLTIIGHSMGTIVVNKIIQTVRRKYQNVHIDNIVYMAAACSIEDATQAIVPYLEEHKNTRFYNLCLHPIREQSEYHLWDFSPRGSLLEWIDSYFATPLIATDRTFGKWENLLTATHLFPSEIGSQVYLRAYDVLPATQWGDERKLNPQFHGDFTKGAFWKSSFWIKNDTF